MFGRLDRGFRLRNATEVESQCRAGTHIGDGIYNSG